ncbi:FAD-dependent oxidoreductase [Nocardia goodfellowii]|uniref:2-polyprenyl-6-methoxyphenol hydroxylase-like FAD-dependent oxidoreductase n=1 Tax=Nocardia goodfellowii TaxID=882446 RepID=A0ABS4QBT3_9NOCA|nr:NAD(P)/FAD-dependent oxidoreductase [Nocardia goodfellowii]MBP2189028.1 2-polyprenyl-6-methoxyphenol hydroxylase-like FAD-dependent oxidoreductase [Nocardia goodfellowii]
MSNRTPNTAPTIAIAGAGLSGLCLAQSLVTAGFDVRVYERDPSPHARRQGYRITADEYGIGALRRCLPPHLFELYLATAGDTRAGGHFRFLNQRMQEIFSFAFEGDPTGADLTKPRQSDRQTLRALLLDGLEDRVHFGKAARRVDVDADGATLHFDDGTSARADLVVGADGTNSPLREQLLPGHAPEPSGMTAIYGCSPLVSGGETLLPPALLDSGVLSVGAPGSAFFCTTMSFKEAPAAAFARLAPAQRPPVANDYVMWAIILPDSEFPSDAQLGSAALYRRAADASRDFHPLLRRLVEAADIDCTLAVPLRAGIRPTRWSVSRVTLMGDAVHTMPPFGAHGGNTALRDAALLGEKLCTARENGASLESAVEAYQREMLAYSFDEVEAAKKMMTRFTTRNPILRWGMTRVAPWVHSLRGKSLDLRADRPVRTGAD